MRFLALLLVMLTGCASLPPTGDLATLPSLPRSARLVLTRPLQCPEGMGVARGFDTNGNGDFEVVEIWREGTRIAVFYYDPNTESEITHAYVQEGSKVVRYEQIALFARFPSLCALMGVGRVV